MKKILAIICLMIMLCCGYMGYTYYKTGHMPFQKKQPVAQAAHPAQAVDVITVSMHQVIPEASFVAKIEARDKVGLRARVTGFLQEKMFNEGDIVAKGQPLFQIEKVNFEAQVRQASANLAKAEAAAVNAKAQYERIETLFKTKDVSASKLDEAKAEQDSAIATVNQMKASLDLAQKDLEYTTIVSPIDGKIGEKAFSVGELIGPNSGVLAEIVSINPIDAVFSVSENQLLTLQEQFAHESEDRVRFITSNGKEYPLPGKINFVDVALDETMNTLKIKAVFPNPDNRLISGQYGRVLLKGKDPIDKIVIPMKAVQRDLTTSYVYLLDKENKVVKQEITTGLELPNFDVIIESGLSGGERVIVAGFQKIAVGMTVSPNPVKE
ncbi:MAG: efflux RND transporter periplasmic adaptor subunit [Pseudomonadota bacterium]|nr:efflux RND transporter periplasmic adaptor subunit [Pseudomonadota bacterium]